MDIQMPKHERFCCGESDKERLQKPDAQIIPIIALSADDTLEDVRKCKEDGHECTYCKTG